jgi:hypothetical protein
MAATASMTWWGWWYIIAGATGAAVYVLQTLVLEADDRAPILGGRRMTGLLLYTIAAGVGGGTLLVALFGVAEPA